jgi:broad specificity phosphatase PhoE|tara:strand:- start:21 stop:647 length:627 start_codon:yes stop_codon:yes gene_type:complete
MKIIALRHGLRFDSALYFTPLTAEGLVQADNLVEILKDEKIDIIYCSPFLRTLQTIYPFCIENNKKVNVENTFYECLNSNEFNYYNYRHNPRELDNTYPHLSSIIDHNYNSQLFVSNISYIETSEKVRNRVFPFIHNLCQKYKKTDKVFLIVTHGTIVNTIKKYFNRKVHYRQNVDEAEPYIIDVPPDIMGPHEYYGEPTPNFQSKTK